MFYMNEIITYFNAADAVFAIASDAKYRWEHYGLTGLDKRGCVRNVRVMLDVFTCSCLETFTSIAVKKPVVLFRGDTAVDFSKHFDNPKLAKSCGSRFRRVFAVLNKAYHDRFIVVDRGTKLEDVEEIVRCEGKSFVPKNPRVVAKFCEEQEIKPTNHLESTVKLVEKAIDDLTIQ